MSEQRIIVDGAGQKIIVNGSTQQLQVVPAGLQGPPGVAGQPGPPGDAASPKAVIGCDFSIKTDPGLPGAGAMSPVADLGGWETAGGPAYWNVPTDKASIVGHADISNMSRTGVYVYDPTVSPSTFTRHEDYTTAESLNHKAVLARLGRSHLDNTVKTPNLPNLILVWTDDPFDSETLADDVVWQIGVFSDLTTTSDYFSYILSLLGEMPTLPTPDSGGADDNKWVKVSGGAYVFTDPPVVESAQSQLDQPWTQVDITNSWADAIFGTGTPGEFSWGTNGQSVMFWTRVGRTVILKFTVLVDVDASSGYPCLVPSQLPYPPITPLITDVGAFCYAAYGETAPGAKDGGLIPMGTAIIAGFGNAMGFVVGSLQSHDGALDNLWAVGGGLSGIYPDLTGRQFQILGMCIYEADSAA